MRRRVSDLVGKAIQALFQLELPDGRFDRFDLNQHCSFANPGAERYWTGQYKESCPSGLHYNDVQRYNGATWGAPWIVAFRSETRGSQLPACQVGSRWDSSSPQWVLRHLGQRQNNLLA